MSLPDQIVPLSLGRGVDTKTDSKAVVASMLRLQDCVFTEGHAVNKRNGNTAITRNIAGGGTLSSPSMIAEFQDQLVCQDNSKLYSYAPSVPAWFNQGDYISCKSTLDQISGSINTQVLQSACLWNNYGIYSWTQQDSYASDTVTTTAKVSIQDTTTNSALLSGSSIGSVANTQYTPAKTFVANTAGVSFPVSIVSINTGGGTTLLSYYKYTIDSTGASLTLGSFSVLTRVTECFSGAPGTAPGDIGVFDAAGTTTGSVVAYGTTTPSLVVKTLDSTGAVTHTFTLAATTVSGIHLSVNATNGNIWVYYIDSANNLKYLVLSSTLSTVLAATSLGVGGAEKVFQVTSIATSATQETVFFSQANSIDPAPEEQHTCSMRNMTATSAGVVSLTTLVAACLDIYSKPFIYGSNTYLLGIFRSLVQGTVFLINTTGTIAGTPVAKALASNAFSYFATYNTGSGVNPNYTQWCNNPCGFIANPLLYSSSKIGFLLPEVTTTNTVHGNLPGFATVAAQSTQLTQSSVASFSFVDNDLYQAIKANNTLVMNGGLLWQYDGASVCELGFNLYPEINKATLASGGSMTSSATYEYAVIYQWTDAQGNFNQSAPFTKTVVMGGSDTKVTLTIVTPGVSIKNTPSPPNVVVFRTAANQTLLRQLVSIASPKSTDKLTFVDTFADVALTGANALYTNGGVLENTGPPPALSLVLYNNRLWAIDTTNDNTVWYCKTLQPQNAIAFSDTLTVQVNAAGGACVALAGMDSNLVIFEEKFPLVIQGDGFNDAGTGSTLTNPQPIPSDAGCTGSKGIIVFPEGILRKTPKGIYRLDRSLSDKYWGADVEAYNSQTITATTLMVDKTQIRFLTSSGLTLVYDYFFNQWSTFTNFEGYSACIYQNEYTYLRTDGTVYQETPGYYLDGPSTQIAPLIRTGWLAMSSIQNFERVRMFNMLGDFVGSADTHGIQVSVAYDFSEDFTNLNPFYLTNTENPPVYQFEGFLPRQKCNSLSIIIQELTTGASNEYITFTDTSFVAGVKKGVNKLKAAAQVG